MRLSITALSLAVLALATDAFAPPVLRHTRTHSTPLSLSTDIPDCGCTTFSGKPSDKALAIDPRQAVGAKPIFSVNGEQTNVNDLIGTKGTSVVIFLRSLG